jgi:Sortase domain
MAPDPPFSFPRLGLVLAVALPAFVMGALLGVLLRGPHQTIRTGGPTPSALARKAERIPPDRPLRPVAARPGAAALGPERLESVDGGIRPAEPVRISIPAAGINARMQSVRVRGGELQVPHIGKAGWYDAGPRPGEDGRAVVIGHLDTRHGPGLFARVPRMKKGARISVLDRRGGVHRYRTVGVTQVRKKRFPRESVYGHARAPVLVLVTCGGPYKKGRGYRDNILLYARAA